MTLPARSAFFTTVSASSGEILAIPLSPPFKTPEVPLETIFAGNPKGM